MTLAFGDDEELEAEVLNTEQEVDEEIDFMLEEEEIDQSKYEWIVWVIASSFAFAACNVLIAELGRESYQTQALYYNSGGLLVPVLYCNFAQAIKKARALKTGRIYRRLFTNPHSKTCDLVMVVLVIMAALI